MGVLLRVVRLRKAFGRVTVIDGWDLEVEEGERVAILGPSGCGKTTFLRIVAGIEKNYEGEVTLKAERIGYAFQEPRLIPWITVVENLRLVRDEPSKIAELLAEFDLEGFEKFYPWQISEGMRQRVNLARALLFEPDLLLLDEPFDALDLKTKIKVMEHIVWKWKEKGFSMVFVTHNLKEALFLADRILIVSGRPTRILDEFVVKERPSSFLDEGISKMEQELTRRILNLLR